MMDTYLVEYYTHENQKVGIQVSAYTAQNAISYAQNFPDFNVLAGYPVKISSGND